MRISYEEMLRESIARIPFYTDEWTSAAPSDPGITILENVTMHAVRLAQRLEDVTEEEERALLRLAGFTPGRGKPSRVLVGAEKEAISRKGRACLYPARQKFQVGDICFELPEETQSFRGYIKAVYTEQDTELSRAREGEHFWLFGERPKEEACVYVLIDMEGGSPLPGRFSLFAEVEEDRGRNPFPQDKELRFAQICWSCLTEKGYEEIWCEDKTGPFLVSGELQLDLGGAKPVRGAVGGETGYIICVRLGSHHYDRAPRLRRIWGPLLPVYETDTKIFSYVLRNGKKEEAIPNVFGEEMHCSFYEQERGNIRAVCCAKSMLPYLELGIVEGARQEIDLSVLPTLFEKSVELMLELERGEGKEHYFFRQGDAAFSFTYEEERRSIAILDPGRFRGAKIRLSGASVYHGSRGNIRAGSRLTAIGGVGSEGGDSFFFTPSGGAGGRFSEKIEDLKKRFRKEVRIRESAVTAEDYERFLKKLPGFIIEEVKAEISQEKREVKIRILTEGEENKTDISPWMRQKILDYVEPVRMLGMRIRIEKLEER